MNYHSDVTAWCSLGKGGDSAASQELSQAPLPRSRLSPRKAWLCPVFHSTMNFLLGYRMLISEEISAPNLCFALSLLPSERKRLVISWALSLNEWMLPAWLSLRQEGSLQIKGQKTTATHPDPLCNTKLLSNIFISTSLLGKNFPV